MLYHFGEKLKRSNNGLGHDCAGFTLLEMLTSLSIIIMITVIFIVNFHSTNKRTDLVMTAQKLVADIHLAQNNTLGLVKYGDTVPAGGWGINFDKSKPGQYIVFADLDQPASNEPGQIWSASSGYMKYDAAIEGVISQGARVVTLPPEITISSITTGTNNPAESTLANVTFLPPDPKTNIFNGTGTSTVVTITLKEADDRSIKTIRVNFLGLVEVID